MAFMTQEPERASPNAGGLDSCKLSLARACSYLVLHLIWRPDCDRKLPARSRKEV